MEHVYLHTDNWIFRILEHLHNYNCRRSTTDALARISSAQWPTLWNGTQNWTNRNHLRLMTGKLTFIWSDMTRSRTELRSAWQLHMPEKNLVIHYSTVLKVKYKLLRGKPGRPSPVFQLNIPTSRKTAFNQMNQSINMHKSQEMVAAIHECTELQHDKPLEKF